MQKFLKWKGIIYSPNFQEAEAGETSWVWGLPGLCAKFQVSLSHKDSVLKSKNRQRHVCEFKANIINKMDFMPTSALLWELHLK